MISDRRILFMGTIPDRSEAALLARLAASGLSISAVFESRSTRVDDLRAAGVAVTHATLRWSQRRSEKRMLARLLSDFDPHVVHIMRSKSLHLLRAACGSIWPPTVFYRGTSEQPRWWQPSHRRKYLDPNIRRLVAISHAVRDALVAGGVPPERVTVIHKGHDPAWYASAPIDFRAEIGVSPETFLMGVVANIRWEKGVEYAVQAAEILAARGSNVHLSLIGDDERAWFERRWRPLQRPGLVSTVGRRNDVAAILPALDALLLPSLREGSPRAIAEAMLRGVPVVASAVGGVPEIIADGTSGLLVAPRDANALADATERLIRDRGLASGFARAAREFVLANLTIASAATQTQQMYDEVIAECGARPAR